MNSTSTDVVIHILLSLPFLSSAAAHVECGHWNPLLRNKKQIFIYLQMQLQVLCMWLKCSETQIKLRSAYFRWMVPFWLYWLLQDEENRENPSPLWMIVSGGRSWGWCSRCGCAAGPAQCVLFRLSGSLWTGAAPPCSPRSKALAAGSPPRIARTVKSWALFHGEQGTSLEVPWQALDSKACERLTC